MKDDRLISLNAAIDAIMKLQTEDIEAYGASIPEGFDGDRAVTALKALPSAQPVNIAKLQPNCNQVASDCISRQAAIDAINKALDRETLLNSFVRKVAVDAVKAMPSAQPSATDTNVATTDTISRQAAISEIMEDIEDRSLHDDPATPEDYAEGYDEGIRNAAAIVLQMPPAQPDHIGEVTEMAGDAVSRQGVLRLLNAVPSEEFATKAMLISGVNALPSAQQWIPCSERLPEAEYPVIVTWKNDDPKSYYQYILGKHYAGVAHYKNGKWYWYSSVTEDVLMEYGRYESEEFDEAIKVLAWMPLPEPWEGGQNERSD